MTEYNFSWEWYERVGIRNLEVFKDCDTDLLDLVERHNKHFKEMGEMTSHVLLYDDKENPNKLLRRLKEKHNFFSSGKWELEQYINKKAGRYRTMEHQLVDYLSGFYIEFYPRYELEVIGAIDYLQRKLDREKRKRGYIC